MRHERTPRAAPRRADRGRREGTRPGQPRVAVRRLGRDDVGAYRDLRLLALRESPTAFGTSYEEEARLARPVFAARLDGRTGLQLFGAFVGDVLVGMVGVWRLRARKERHRAEIRSMFVRPESRGAGVGARLLTHALDAAAAMPGVRQVSLTVTAGNTAARRLYEAHGFTVYGQAPEALFVDGVYYDDVLMVRRLAA